MFGCRARNLGGLQPTELPSGSSFFVPAAGLVAEQLFRLRSPAAGLAAESAAGIVSNY